MTLDELREIVAALYRMKRDTVRAIDRADAAALRARFGLTDE